MAPVVGVRPGMPAMMAVCCGEEELGKAHAHGVATTELWGSGRRAGGKGCSALSFLPFLQAQHGAAPHGAPGSLGLKTAAAREVVKVHAS